MTRIAGLIESQFHGPQVDRLRGMLAACRQVPGAQLRAEGEGGCAIGSIGRRDDSLVSVGGVVVCLDGHIYNRRELGDFRTDAEAIAELYAQYGFRETLDRLNGDFAIALFDSAEGVLWLARDRFGVKPLYYHVDGSHFAFASRPRALLSLPYVSREINVRFEALFAASHYRYFDNDPEASPFVAIRQLPAGQALRFKDGDVSKTRYWTLGDEPDWAEPEEELSERYRALLLDAVSIRVRCTDRPAFTLSGGMDSSSVLSCAVQSTGRKQHAFSTVYSDATFDESQDIRSILEATVEEWHQVLVDMPDVFAIVEKMVAAHDEPVATATWLSHYVLCKQAADAGFSGLLGGLGGDELNAGEFEHFLYFFADLRTQGLEDRLMSEIRKWVEHHDHPLYRKSATLVERQLNHLVDLRTPGRCIAERGRMMRYASAINRDFFDLTTFEPVLEHPFGSYLKNRTYQDLTRETIPCCLRAEDRHCEAFGLDGFLPFFDVRLVEFMFRVPSALKYRSGVTKSLLRSAMRGILPEETRTRVKKTGWNAPAHIWFSNVCGDQLRDLIHSQQFRERGLYNVAEVERLLAEHRRIVTSGALEENHMMFFWQLVNLETWLTTCAAATSTQNENQLWNSQPPRLAVRCGAEKADCA